MTVFGNAECLMILLLYLLSITHLAVTRKQCYTCEFGSAVCKCQQICQQQVKADCSNRRIRTIPMFSVNVSWIDLSGNFIELIDNEFPRNALYIDLSRNWIKNLDGQPFRGLKNLTELNLEGNRININLFNKGLFSDLQSLTELNLKANIQNELKRTIINDEVFAELSSLQTLKIDGPTNITFGKGFLNLSKLRKLDLSGITGNCTIGKISLNTFLYLPNLVYIDVSACGIVDIEAGVFGNLSKLEHLDVSYNKHLGLASLPNITYNLNQTSIKVLRSSGITCWSGIGTMVRKHHLVNLKGTNITDIFLEKNRIELFEPGALRLLPDKLVTMSLGENKLTQGSYILDYSFMRNIRVINISVQLRPAPYPDAIFEQCHENTEPCELSISTSRDIKSVDTASLQPRIHKTKLQKKPLFTYYLPQTLTVLYGNVSRFYSYIPEVGINATNLKEIYLQDNFLYTWIGPVHCFENVEILDMSNNFCSHISKGLLKYATGLKVLKLSKNDIGRSLSEDIDGEIFENAVSVEYLDLSQNNIITLPKPMFKNIKKMQELHLEKNDLYVWRVEIKHMLDLKFINLERNRLTTFEKEARNSFQHSFQVSNLTINLSGNKLLCSCENVAFLSWITQYKAHFKNFEKYECSTNNVQSFNFSNAERSLLTLKKRCKSYLSVYIGCSVSAAFLISILISALLVKNKWKIRYLVFKFKQRLRQHRGYSSDLRAQTSCYEYDAMISYSQKELSFILTDLIPHLEKDTGIHLYIKHRNEPVGIGKGEAVMNAIQNSRRVICLISKKYLKSKWKDFELNMARMEAIEDRENMNFIHLIIFPDVYNDSFPSVIADLIKLKCFTEYPEEQCALEDFWENISSLISKDTY